MHPFLERSNCMESGRPERESIVVSGRGMAAEGIWEKMLAQLQEHGYGEDDIFAVRLAFEEAFANAVKHGNKMDLSKEVRVDYSITSEQAEITISDQGGGFDPEGIPDPRRCENIYKSQGRGVLLIRSYMDEVVFNPQGNCVYMKRRRRLDDAEKN